MSQVKLDAARLAADGAALHSIAQSVSQAVRACESALGGTGGMAGDDESAEVFAQGQDGEPGYDQYAVDVMKAALGVANSLRIVDAALGNTGRAYDGAQLVGAFKPAASSGIPEETPTIVPPSASVPSSLGKGPEGPLGEFGDFLKDALATLGVMLPSADRGKLSAAESAWGELSGSLSRAQGRIDSAFTNVSAMTLPQQGKMLSCQTSLSTSLGRVADSADSMAGFAAGMREAVDKAWEEIGWFIAQMAVEIGIEIGIGALLGAVTFGAGAAAMAAKIMLTVTRWALKIAALCRKLRTLIMMALRAARMAIRGGIRVGREALSAGLASGITTVSFNTVRGALDPSYQPQNVLTAALSSAIGGGAGGIASGAGGRLTSGVGNNALQRVTHIGVETGSGALDGLASGLAESSLNGTPFSPLSSMAAGALLGGALSGRPGGNAGAPTSAPGNAGGAGGPGGAGTSTPDTSSIPSGTGTNASAGNGQGNAAPVGVSNDAPTPGSGGGGSSQSGGGGAVDVSNDAPTPGAGDAGGSSAGDGGGVDVPSASDAPTAPASLDGDAPSAPSVDAPSAPAADAPSAPSVDAPSAPAADAPSAPAADAPSAPAADAPSAPAADAPSAPSVDAPSAPAADAPSAPAADAPSAPAADAPSAPAADAPSAPAADAPSAPSVDAPSAPAGDAPSAPAADAPTAPAADAPSAPSSDVPSAPAGDAPSAPAADAPSAPAGDAPVGAGVPAATSPAAASPAVDAPLADAPLADAPVDGGNTDGTDADGAGADGTAPAEGDGPAPEELAVVGGAAAAGVAAFARPSFLPPFTGGGGSAPTAPKPQGSAPSSGAPGDGTGANPVNAADPAADGSQPGDGAEAAQPEASAQTEASTQPDAAGQADADQTPGDEPGHPNNASTRTIDEIDAALTGINPNFDWSDPSNGYATNCGHTSSNLNDFLTGSPMVEAPGGSTLDTPQMEGRTGNPQTPMTPDQIEASLRAMGPGSHCVVGIDRSTGDGHWFNAYFDGDQVWTLDAQTGDRSPWPPHEPDATLWDASIRPEDVADAATPDAQPDAAAPGAIAAPTAPATPDATAPATPDATAPAAPDATAPASPADADPSRAGTDPAPTPWDESMGDPVLSGADHGPGWERVEDRVTHNPLDPAYGDPRAPGESGALADSFAHPGTVPDEISHLISDPDAPYGRADDGTPYTRTEWEARYTDRDGWPIYPGNDGGTLGSFVEFDDLDAFISHYGDQLDRMGGPSGGFFSMPGTPFEYRALPPSNLSDPYSIYELSGSLPPGTRIEVSEIAPAFGRPGGGLQVRILDADGRPMSVDQLIDAGVLGRTDVDGAAGQYTPTIPSSGRFGAGAGAFGADASGADGFGSDGSAGDGTADAPADGADPSAAPAPEPASLPVDLSANQSPMGADAVVDLVSSQSVNPNHDGDPHSPFSVNCGSTASTLNGILRGGDPAAQADVSSRDVGGMEADTGVPQVVLTPEQIEATLQHLGPGSHTVVGVVRNTGMGHWFVAYNHNGTIVTLDPQTGAVDGWPPAMGDVRFGHAGFHPTVVEAATGVTPELQPWSSFGSGVETANGASRPATALPDLGAVWNPASTPPANLTPATPSQAPTPPADPAGDFGADPARSPLNAREEQLTARFEDFVAASRDADALPDGPTVEEFAELERLMSGEHPAIAMDGEGRLVIGESLELQTACPANCDPAEMDLQFRDASGVLNEMTVTEWMERRVAFINHPEDYRDVSGSTAAQKATRDEWLRDRTAQLQQADPTLTRREAARAARAEAAELNATHRLDMVAGGDPTDISGMNGGAENQAIGGIFQRDFVPQIEAQVLRFLERVPASMWDSVHMHVTIREVS
jgi:hypothetical protein